MIPKRILAPLLAAFVVSCVAAPSLAQTNPPAPAPISKAEADAAIMAYYPAKARAARVGGVAYLRCGFSDQIRLKDCALLGEYPTSYAFGAAALALSKLSRENPDVPPKPRPGTQEVEFRFSLDPPLITPNPLLPTHFQAPATFMERPSASQMAIAYPRRAKNHDVSGRAVLDCAVEAERLADCKIAQETPLGWDFGAAALNLSSIFHLRPIMVDGEIDLNARVQIPMAFTIP